MRSGFRIPTIIALLILLVGLGSLIFLLEKSPAFLARGASTPVPESVTVANVTDREFSVAWITAVGATGLIEYSEKGLLGTPRLARDVRDEEKLLSNYTHLVTATALKPNATYQFVIVSGGRKFEDPRFTVTTGTSLPPPTHTLDPAFGTLEDNGNRPVADALAYVSFAGSQTLAGLTDENGRWVLPLGTLRAQNASRYFIPRPKDEERLLFVDRTTSATAVTTTEHDSPLVPIRMGEAYDFTRNSKSRGGPLIAQAQAATTNTALVNATFQVLLPEENAAIPSGKPAVKGTGLSGKPVIVTLSGPDVTSGKVAVAANGSWSWTPSRSLAPGKYTGTFVSFDEKNTALAITRSFILLKSGSSVLQAATPAASLVPTPRPSPTPKTATPSATASPNSQVPTTGTFWPTLALLVLGALTIAFGSVHLSRR